jgi:nucleolar protein 56
MKITLIESSFGLLAIDQNGELIDRFLYPKKPQKAAAAVLRTEAGKMSNETQSFVKALLEKSFDTFVFENQNLAETVKNILAIDVEIATTTEAGDIVRRNTEKIALEAGFVKDSEEFNQWMRNVSMEIAKLKVRGSIERRDLIVAQAIQALDDLERTINLLMSRIREWYGIQFPELDRHLDKHETYCRLVVDLGYRDSFTVSNLAMEGVPETKIQQIAKAAESSMGADIAEQDLGEIQALCKSVLNLYDLRQELEKYMDNVMQQVAPNIKSLVGSLLGARLIAIGGGLQNVARLPASTIQVLGAEKALFRSLKTGTRPPKHGLIFQHTYLHDAQRWQRGKLARALAGKLAIAARADAFGNRDISKLLKEGLDRRVEEIRQKYREPPPIPEKKPRYEHADRNQRGKNRRKFRREFQR